MNTTEGLYYVERALREFEDGVSMLQQVLRSTPFDAETTKEIDEAIGEAGAAYSRLANLLK